MNGDVINSLIDRIARANGTAEKELQELIDAGEITKEEAAVIHLRASLQKVNTSLEAAIEAAS